MITLTQNAKTKLLKLVNENGKSIFLYVKGGGCNGFSFKFKILDTLDKPHKLDETQFIDTNLPLHICHKSLMFVLNTKVDYIEDIMGSRFDFENSSIESKCGCGTSMSFK